jgi:hypothetical protein
MRLEMLGGTINTGSYNNALQVTAPVYGVQYFKMAGLQPKCEYCIKYYGRIYRQGMFMPSFLPIQIALTPGTYGFQMKKNQRSQHSGTNTSNPKQLRQITYIETGCDQYSKFIRGVQNLSCFSIMFY